MAFPHPNGSFYVRTNTGAPNYRTARGELHAVTPADLDEWFPLVNAMENIDFVALPFASEHEVPPEAIDVFTLHKALLLSKKHIWIQPYGTESVSHLIALSQAAAGGERALRARPIVSFISCSVPLLSFKHMDAEIILRCAEAGIPVQPCSLPTAGANTPVTAQGTALVCCAEVLAQIVMLELLCPGLPVIATPLLFSMDMKTTCTLQSNPEITLGRLICMQFFRESCGIAVHSYGCGTDSAALDAQNGMECASLMHMMALSDADVLGGAGQLETAKTISPIQLILDNEALGIAKRMRRGLVIDDEMLDTDELFGDPEELTDGFIMTDHTLRHYAEATRPALFNRGGLVAAQPLAGEDPALRRYYACIAKPETMTLAPDRRSSLDASMAHAIQTLTGKENPL